MRLAVFSSHPIQYKSPLYRALAVQSDLDLQVYYYSKLGIEERSHPYHGFVYAWDVPLLNGYPYKFLPNILNEAGWKIDYFQPYINPLVMSEIFRGRYNAVIIHSYQHPSDWLAFLCAKALGIAVLFYGDLYPHRRLDVLHKIARKLFHTTMIRGSDACLAIGTVASEVYKSEYHVSNEKIFLAPYAVDNKYFIDSTNYWKPKSCELKIKMKIPPEVPVVLCVGGMVPKKRQQDLIDAVKMIDLPARLVLIGHGTLYNEIYDYCRDRLPDTILTGFINQSELPRYYAMADIFVLPSLWEEFGLVVNEAMCAGLPIITSNTVAASRDLIYEGENGYTVPPGDVLSLAQKIQLLLEDEDMRHDFGKRSLDIISGWNYSRTVEGIQKAIDHVSSN